MNDHEVKRQQCLAFLLMGKMKIKIAPRGNSVLVQCLGLGALTAGAQGWILVQGTKIHQPCSVA